MKNRSFKILQIFLLFIAFGINFNSNSVDAYCELKNGTLTIHNEVPGKLLEGYKKSDDYTNIIVKGQMSKADFMDLSLISYQCESINVLDVDASDIPPSLFRRNPKLKSFIFPKKLKTIGAFSFSDCNNLEKAELPNTIEKIEKCAFEYCEKLNLTLPNTVLRGNYAFNGCPHVSFMDVQNDNNSATMSHKNVFLSFVGFVSSFF